MVPRTDERVAEVTRARALPAGQIGTRSSVTQ
jgi:hypothetical protein